MLCLQSSEQGLLSTQDLDCGTSRLGQGRKGPSMRNQPSANQFTNQSSKIGSESVHSRSQIVRQALSVIAQIDHLLSHLPHHSKVFVGNLATHGNISRGFDGGFDLFRKNRLQRVSTWIERLLTCSIPIDRTGARCFGAPSQ